MYGKEKQAGLGGALGQAEHRFSLHKVPLGAGEEVFMYNYPSLIKGSLLFMKYPDMSVTHSADTSLNHEPPNCTFQQHLVVLGPSTCGAARATALKRWVSVTILI